MEVELKPILVALVINLTLIFALPRLFSAPTGFKAFDDFGGCHVRNFVLHGSLW
jgi:hypothetical protein